MEPGRVVEILQDGRSRGSGYLITPRHVLTARHVLVTATKGAPCAVRSPGAAGKPDQAPLPGTRPEPLPATVGWISAAHDLAVVQLERGHADGPDTAPPAFGKVPEDGIARQVMGSGFPEAAGADQRTIIGTITWVPGDIGRFDIDVISTLPREWKKWGGFSGAAIFSDNALVGVVRTVDPNWRGKLEATPAAWLLQDASFTEYLRKARVGLPKTRDVGPVDRIMPLDFEADTPAEGTLRFSPRNPRVPFLGREPTFARLEEFLGAEAPRPFSWWLMTGSGGMGKTRFARELCLRLRRRGWRAGFLPRTFAADRDLDVWSPHSLTLIVADYVMKRIDEIRILAARLARRDGVPRLRLLLLEREAGELFENRFLGSDQGDRGLIEHTRHQPDPLVLPSLSEDEIWTLVQSCKWRGDDVRLPVRREEFFHRLGRLDRQRRPLVAMILADAIAASGARTDFSRLDAVLRDLLRRDRDHLWPQVLGAAGTVVGTTEADIAVAFATMVDGLDPSGLDAIRDARGRPIDPAILPACGVAIGKPLGQLPRLGRLEPDLIGEFFALETLGGDHRNPFATAPHGWMPATAWRTNGSAMFDFVARAMQTFPGHPAIGPIATTVNGVKESWALAALAEFVRVIRSEASYPEASRWAVGIRAARRWLQQRARSDVSAALAFIDLHQLELAHQNDDDAPEALAACDGLRELADAYPDEPTLHAEVARALFSKAVWLGALGRPFEEIAVYDAVLARFGAAANVEIREHVARVLVNKGATLATLTRGEEAIAAFDEVIARFGASADVELREQVARALVNKGAALASRGQSKAAIAVFDEMISRFGTAAEAGIREQVAGAIFNMGFTYGSLGEAESAIRSYNAVAERFGAAVQAGLRKHVARSLVNKGIALGSLGRSEAEIAAYDEVVERFGTAAEPGLREQVARALFNKGVRLGKLGRTREALEVYDDLLARFGATGEAGLGEQIARALVNKGFSLGMVQRSEGEIAAYDEVVERFGTAAEPGLREQVARALFNKGVRLGKLGRTREALEVYNDLLTRFGTADEAKLLKRVADALINKGSMLAELGRIGEAIVVYDTVVARFGSASEPALRNMAALAGTIKDSLRNA